jgi:hypothetical protein
VRYSTIEFRCRRVDVGIKSSYFEEISLVLRVSYRLYNSIMSITGTVFLLNALRRLPPEKIKIKLSLLYDQYAFMYCDYLLILSGGSLGSWVDEKRGKTRELM